MNAAHDCCSSSSHKPVEHSETPQGVSSRFHRPSVNITPTERFGRIAVGLLAAVAGVVLLTTAASTLVVILEVLLIAAGLDLVVTGALGHCPLYARLGYVPRSLGRTS